MELDEMKLAWAEIARKLDDHAAFDRRSIREAMGQRAFGRLRPLFWGQIAQIIFGAIIIMLSVAYWSENRGMNHRAVMGILMHVYGVLAIMMAGMMIATIRAVDWSNPVAEIQARLERLRSLYLVCTVILGLTWWVLWLPFIQVLFGLAGADLYANVPEMFFWGIAGGLLGMAVSIAIYRWSLRLQPESFGRKLDEHVVGQAITGAFEDLDLIREIENDC